MSFVDVRTPEGGVLAVDHQRLAVHHEHPHVALGRLGEVLLRHDVAVARDRLDDLLEVRRLLAVDQEHARAARALERLEDRLAAEVLDELLDHVLVARDERARADDLGEVLEVGLRQRVGEAGRVVDHEHAAGGDQLAEGDAGVVAPRVGLRVVGGVVAQHHHVELVQPDELLDVGLLDVRQVPLEGAVGLGVAGAGLGAQRPVGLVGEVADAHVPGLVPHLLGGHGEAVGGVLRLLRLDVVDDESDLHACPSRSVLRSSVPAARARLSCADGSCR